MWELFNGSFQLFLKGKLFRQPAAVFRQWLIGFAVAVTAIVALVKMNAPLWLSIVLVALAVGVLQPFLFKNLKYA